MSTKEAMIEMIRQLPDEATLDELLEELAFRMHVEEGLRDADNGDVITHEEFKRQAAKWLK